MSDTIEYHNELRRDPLVLDRYIYVVVQEGIIAYRIIDSYYNEEDANAAAKTLEANSESSKFIVHKSRLYK